MVSTWLLILTLVFGFGLLGHWLLEQSYRRRGAN